MICDDEHVDEPNVPAASRIVRALRESGARFAFLHGSRARGEARVGSDIDVAAWWGDDNPPAAWEVDLPAEVDLIVLDTAPLELAGRVALEGQLLYDDDPPARIEWQAQTRTIYFDEQPRQRWISDVFLEAHARG